MQFNVLDDKQKKLLPWLTEFAPDFSLVGGTAIALQIGHRQSIDFDLFSLKDFDNFKLQNKILRKKKISRVLVNHPGELTFIIDQVKITFLYFPFKFKSSLKVSNNLKTPDLLTLAALKAYALSRRAKWKDYVDLYFIFQNYSLAAVVKKAQQIFSDNFNEKIFRTQLAYFKDIDYSETVMYEKKLKISDNYIKKFLTEISLQI